MDDKDRDPTKFTRRRLALNIIKAAAKGIIVYVIYYVAWSFISPIAQMIPSLQQTIQLFVMIYLVLLIVGELTSGTIYHYFFNTGRALFVIGYLIMSLKTGVLGGTFENLAFSVDLRLLLTFAVLLSLPNLAKSVIQTISYLNQKAEYTAAL